MSLLELRLWGAVGSVSPARVLRCFSDFPHSDLRHVLMRLILKLPEGALKVSEEHTPVCVWHVQIGNAEPPHPAQSCCRFLCCAFAVNLGCRLPAPVSLCQQGSADCSLTFIFRGRQVLSKPISESPPEELIQQILQTPCFLLFLTFHSSVACNYRQYAATGSSASQRVAANRASVLPLACLGIQLDIQLYLILG